ncbi:MAG: hypothetical protein U1E53_09155 [Dongiaceae bacterium]
MTPLAPLARAGLAGLLLMLGAGTARAAVDEEAAVAAIRALPEVRAFTHDVALRDPRPEAVLISIEDSPVAGCKSGDGECDWLISVAEDKGEYRVGYQDFLVDSQTAAIRLAPFGSDAELPYEAWHKLRDGKPWREVRHGAAGPIDWRWRDDDFTASRGAQLLLSLRALADADFARWLAAGPDPANAAADVGCWHIHRLVPRSLVGTLLGFDDIEQDVCGHEPHEAARRLALDIGRPGPTRYADADLAIDPARPGQAVSLADYVPAEAIRAALLQSPEVKKRLGTAAAPAGLDPLIAALAAHDRAGEGCPGMFTADVLTRFDVERVSGETMVVSLGLSGRGDCAATITPVELTLPGPDGLRAALAAAADGSGGFLAGDPPPDPLSADIQVYHDLPVGD